MAGAGGSPAAACRGGRIGGMVRQRRAAGSADRRSGKIRRDRSRLSEIFRRARLFDRLQSARPARLHRRIARNRRRAARPDVLYAARRLRCLRAARRPQYSRCAERSERLLGTVSNFMGPEIAAVPPGPAHWSRAMSDSHHDFDALVASTRATLTRISREFTPAVFASSLAAE